MNFFDHKDLGNHFLQLCPEVVKHPVYLEHFTNQSHEILRVTQKVSEYLRKFPRVENLLKEQDSFNLVIKQGAQRACPKA